MPIPVINFAQLPTQGNSALENLIPALQQGLALGGAPKQMMLKNEQSKLANALSGVQLKYAPEMSESELQNRKLQNALAQVQLQYAPQNEQADLAYKLAQAGALPYQAMGSYYGGLGRMNYSNWASSPNSLLTRLINTPQMQNLIATNPKVAQQVTSALGNIATSATGMPNLPQANIGLMPQGSNMALNQDQIQQLKSSGQFGFQPTPQDVQNVQQATGDAFLKKTQTTAQQNQRLYAATLDGLFNEGDNYIDNVAKYSGISGILKKNTDAFKSGILHKTTPEYSDYLIFTNKIAPNAANEMRRVLGGQATDSEQKLMSSLSRPDAWNVSPSEVKTQWSAIKKLYKNIAGRTLTKSPYQIQNELSGNGSPPPMGNPAMEDNPWEMD